jgi:hypothetical protein
MGEDTLRERTNELIRKLRSAIPGSKQEIRRWDYLRLSLPVESVKEIRGKAKWDDAVATALIAIEEHCLVVDSFGEATKHFGYDKLEEDVKLKDLAERWESLSRADSPKWPVALYHEMTRVIKNHPAEPTWNLLKSVRKGTNWWFAPIVNHVRVVPERRCWEFDLYLYSVPASADGTISLSIDECEAVMAQ